MVHSVLHEELESGVVHALGIVVCDYHILNNIAVIEYILVI